MIIQILFNRTYIFSNANVLKVTLTLLECWYSIHIHPLIIFFIVKHLWPLIINKLIQTPNTSLWSLKTPQSTNGYWLYHTQKMNLNNTRCIVYFLLLFPAINVTVYYHRSWNWLYMGNTTDLNRSYGNTLLAQHTHKQQLNYFHETWEPRCC